MEELGVICVARHKSLQARWISKSLVQINPEPGSLQLLCESESPRSSSIDGDKENSAEVTWNLNAVFVENGYTASTKLGGEKAQFKNDVLSCSWRHCRSSTGALC